MGAGKTLLKNGRRIVRSGGRQRVGDGGVNDDCCCEPPQCCCKGETRVPVAYRLTFSGIVPPTGWDQCIITPAAPGPGIPAYGTKPEYSASDLNRTVIVGKCDANCDCRWQRWLPTLYSSARIGADCTGIEVTRIAEEAAFAISPDGSLGIKSAGFAYQRLDQVTVCAESVTGDNNYTARPGVPPGPWHGQVVAEPIYEGDPDAPTPPPKCDDVGANCSFCLRFVLKNSAGTTIVNERMHFERGGIYGECAWRNGFSDSDNLVQCFVKRGCGGWDLDFQGADLTNGKDIAGQYFAPYDGTPCPPASGWLLIQNASDLFMYDGYDPRIPWVATLEDCTVPCPTDCAPCCPSIVFTFSDGSVGGLVKDQDSTTCAYDFATSGNATDLTCAAGVWTGTFSFVVGGSPEFHTITANGDADGCPPIDPAAWDVSDLPGGITLTNVQCLDSGCECGDPGCDACTYGNDCCACADAVAHIEWFLTQDTPDGFASCPGVVHSGSVTFPLCDLSATDDVGTLYVLQDSGIPGTVRININPPDAGSSGIHPFLDVPCKGGTATPVHSGACGGSTYNATMTVTGCS